MIEKLSYIPLILVFGALTGVFGYHACTSQYFEGPFIAMVLQGTLTGIFTVLTIREFLK